MLIFPNFEKDAYAVALVSRFTGKEQEQEPEREDWSYLTSYGVRKSLEENNANYPCEQTLIKVDPKTDSEEEFITVEVSGLIRDQENNCYIYDPKYDRFNCYGVCGELYLITDIYQFENLEDGPRIVMEDDKSITFDDGAHFVRCGRGMFKLVSKIRWTWLPQ